MLFSNTHHHRRLVCKVQWPSLSGSVTLTSDTWTKLSMGVTFKLPSSLGTSSTWISMTFFLLGTFTVLSGTSCCLTSAECIRPLLQRCPGLRQSCCPLARCPEVRQSCCPMTLPQMSSSTSSPSSSGSNENLLPWAKSIPLRSCTWKERIGEF